jgi:3-phosphoglycerate kinase
MRMLERFFKILDTLITSGLFANIFLAVALGASMNHMWSLLNAIQIVSHVTLLAVSLPSNVGICLSSIVDTSNVQVFP